MFKKVKLPIVLIVALILTLSVVTPAFADPPVPPPGLPPGWTYMYVCMNEDRTATFGAGTYVLWLTKSFKTFLLAHPDITLIQGMTFGRCHAPKDPTVMDLTSGESYDIYYGNCGVHIPVASTWGTASVSRVGKTGIFAFAHDPCEFSFVNNAGDAVTNFGAPVTYYFNLTHNLYQKYENGKIGLFVNDGTGWVQCSEMLVGVDLENGDYGRLACTVNAVGRFALGYVK